LIDASQLAQGKWKESISAFAERKKKSPAAAPQEEAELADGIYTLVKSLLKEKRRRRMGNYAGEKKRERERDD
jgi:hypothetical protein